MAVTTSRIICPAGVYTVIATAATNVSFRIKDMLKTTQGRLAVSSSLPAPSATGYVAVSNRKWKEFGSLTDNMYFMPIGADATLEVMKG